MLINSGEYRVEINHPKPKDRRNAKTYAQGLAHAKEIAGDNSATALASFVTRFTPRNQFDRGVRDGINALIAQGREADCELLIVDTKGT